MLFDVQQRIKIQSTEELPTKYNGQFGWIEKQFKTQLEFWSVFTEDGNVIVLHQSQIQPA